MVNKRKASHSSTWIRPLVIVISAVLILTAAVGGTLAYLSTNSGPVENTFTPSKVNIEIEEDFDPGDTIKKNVQITNTGDTDAYVRAMVLINWKKGDNVQPAKETDYKLKESSSDWVKNGEFYYYTKVLPVGKTTTNLIDSIEVVGTAPDGYTLSVEILASAVQSVPDTAVKDAWGFIPG